MPQATKKSRLTIEGDRVLEIIDISPTQGVEEEDTSTIDAAENAYNPRIDIELGIPVVSMNLYDDPTDVGQAHIVLGANGLEIIWYPVGAATGDPRWTYSNCIITKDDPATVAYKGKYKRSVEFKANGGLIKDVVPV